MREEQLPIVMNKFKDYEAKLKIVDEAEEKVRVYRIMVGSDIHALDLARQKVNEFVTKLEKSEYLSQREYLAYDPWVEFLAHEEAKIAGLENAEQELYKAREELATVKAKLLRDIEYTGDDGDVDPNKLTPMEEIAQEAENVEAENAFAKQIDCVANEVVNTGTILDYLRDINK